MADTQVIIDRASSQIGAQSSQTDSGSLSGLVPASMHAEPAPAGMRVYHLKPPILSAVEQMAGNFSLTSTLRKDWKQQHSVIQHASEPPLLTTQTASKCWLAGRCLCSREGKVVEQFTQSLKKQIRNLCIKGKPLYEVFKSGSLVFELLDSSQRSWWVHVSYPNMKSVDVSFMRHRVARPRP